MKKSPKKLLTVLLLAALVFSIAPKYSHVDASSSHVSISVSPKELANEGNVTVTITLTNTNSGSSPATPTPTTIPTEPTETPTPTPSPDPTDPIVTPQPSEGEGAIGSAPYGARSGGGEYSNITISNAYGVSFPTAGVIITAGSSKSFNGTLHVTPTMIGVNLSFTVSWVEYGVTKSETATCKVNRMSASPYLSVIRTANPINATVGTDVTVTYTFTNTGTVKLVNISLVDKYVNGGSTATMLTPFSLDPGATKEFIYSFKMGNATVVSAPVVTFYALGNSTPLVKNVSALTIGLIQTQLTKEIVRGNQTPDGVKFTLYLTNNGNQKLNSLIVKDELGNLVSSAEFSLAVGETKVLEYFVANPSKVRYVVFNISGLDYNHSPFKDNTASYVVRPYIDASLLNLSFTAVTTTSLSEENVIGIEFFVENTGSLEFYHLSITEKDLGYELYSWDKLEVGKSDKAESNVNIGGPRDLVFILTAEDSSGNTYTHEAYVTAEHIDYDAMIPHDDPSSGDSPIAVVENPEDIGKKFDGLWTNAGQKLQKWFHVLGYIAAAAAILMIGLGISEIIIRRNKRSKKS